MVSTYPRNFRRRDQWRVDLLPNFVVNKDRLESRCYLYKYWESSIISTNTTMTLVIPWMSGATIEAYRSNVDIREDSVPASLSLLSRCFCIVLYVERDLAHLCLTLFLKQSPQFKKR